MQPLIRGLRVVEAVARHEGPVGVGELSRIVELPKSTVQRILRGLADARWVEPTDEPVTRWQLGAQLPARLGVAPRDGDLRRTALPHMHDLGRRTDETIHLIVTAPDGLAMLVERVDSTQPVRTYNEIGATSPLHATAGGKAMLAWLPETELDEYLSRPLEVATANTQTDPQQLREQLVQARTVGFAVNLAENRAGVCAIGAPIVVRDRPVAAVVISMPDSRFAADRLEEWGRMAADCATAIAADLAG